MSPALFPLRDRYSQAAAVHGELDWEVSEKELLLAVAVRFWVIPFHSIIYLKMSI